MPSGKVHRWFEKRVLGKVYNVGKVLDWPAKFLGPSHRRYFHDTKTILLSMAIDKDIGKAVALHIALDKAFKGKKAKLLEVLLSGKR